MSTVRVTHTSPGRQGPFEVVVGFDGAGQCLRGGDFLRLDLHDRVLGSVLGLLPPAMDPAVDVAADDPTPRSERVPSKPDSPS